MIKLPTRCVGTVIIMWLAGCTPEVSAAPATPELLAGPITVRVDARDAPQMMLHAKLRIPARPGKLTLVYPKWVPGTHGPTGKVADISGLRFSVDGKELAWRRDPELTSEFSMTLPAGSAAVDVELDVVVDNGWGESTDVSDLNWQRVVLYPKGARSHDLQVDAGARIPSGWHYGTALPIASESDGALTFKPVSLETLVDSPVVMGLYGRTIDLGTALGASHSLELVAETKEALAASDKQIALYRKLVAEATTLFGARHYDKYAFLHVLSGNADHINGLEHHASSENLTSASVFSKDDDFRVYADNLAHEYAHSWCGKFRRPKGLATPDFQQPMRGDLLWVYEGLTNYYGWLLATRSGLESAQDAKDYLAMQAAKLDSIPGRKWRSLGDTMYTPAFGQSSNRSWYSAQRRMDYYPEGLLIWLEADTIIRQKTGAQRSLDDFARAFLGGTNTSPEVKTYELADVLKALGDVVSNDWKGFFEQRITAIAPRAPLGGIESAGYKLSYRDKPNELQSVFERTLTHQHSEAYTLGLVLDDKGVVVDLYLDGAAARAGLPQGATLVAVNGRKYSADALVRAIADNKGSSAPIELLAERGGFFRAYRVTWNQGLRYPYLERDTTKPDLLAAVTAPRTSAAR